MWVELMKASVLFILTIIFSVAYANQKGVADANLDHLEIYLNEYLSEFRRDTYNKMQSLPDIITGDGRMLSRSHIKIGSELRHRSEHQDIQPLIAPTAGDQVGAFLENQNYIRNILTLHQSRLQAMHPSFRPWEDSYWPMHKGFIAIRYADNDFPNSKKWLVNYDYFLKRPPSLYVPHNVSALSSAEKYDLLIGNDGAWPLTNFMWNEGKKQYDLFGKVAGWQGICHGWAAASHFGVMEARSAVTVASPAGLPITFYKSDIQALVSWLWATASPQALFVGSRCASSNPPKNKFGRILDESCFDANPGSWHLAITNQIGIKKKSLVMDSTYHSEVWNYPVTQYRYYYFNPQTMKPYYNPLQAIIQRQSYNADKFTEFRSENAKYIVGIAMDVFHPALATPSPSTDELFNEKAIRYIYDLELDAEFNVIGGEWYTNAHPDFLWTFPEKSAAMTVGDLKIQEPWTGAPIPSQWLEIAGREANRGKILAHIVNEILARSISAGH